MCMTLSWNMHWDWPNIKSLHSYQSYFQSITNKWSFRDYLTSSLQTFTSTFYIIYIYKTWLRYSFLKLFFKKNLLHITFKHSNSAHIKYFVVKVWNHWFQITRFRSVRIELLETLLNGQTTILIPGRNVSSNSLFFFTIDHNMFLVFLPPI
jgi:hypothetical protein